MPKIQMVGLQRGTEIIIDNFFNDIDKLDVENEGGYQRKLPLRVKEFFDAMNQQGKSEFVCFLKEDEFKNMNSDKQKKYTDAFYCLVALIVAEYSESDLLRYFVPEKYSIEAKPTLESNSWRIVYWAQLLGYWVRKLFNTQRFVMVDADTANISLGSAIKEIKEDFRNNNYLSLHKHNSSFNENLGIVVGKFVENHNIANDARVDNDTSSNGDVSPRGKSPDTEFSEQGFKNLQQTPSTSQVVSPPPAPTLPPAPAFVAPKAPEMPQPSTSSVKTPHSKPTGSDRDNLLAAIRLGIKLKPVNEGEKLPINSNTTNSNDLMSALKDVLSKRRDVIQDDLEKTHQDNNEDWVDGPNVIESFYFVGLNDEQLKQIEPILDELIPSDLAYLDLKGVINVIKIALDRINVTINDGYHDVIEGKAQSQKITNTIGKFFSGLFASKKEADESVKNMTFTP